MTEPISLPAVLDLNAASPLRASLLEHRGEPLCIDASQVSRLGGLCLQVLLSAARTWADDGRNFEITPRSAAFDEALTLFGASAKFDDEQLLGVG